VIEGIAMKSFASAMAVLIAAPAFAGDLLPLHHGSYSSAACDDPPNAALLDYDGTSLTGAHTAACTTHLVKHEANHYVLRETCPAEHIGGETMARALDVTENIVILSADSFRLSTTTNASDARTFHRCAKQ
jgi:hypothetical protein